MTAPRRQAGTLIFATLAVSVVVARQASNPQETATPPPTGLIVGQTFDGSTSKPLGGTIVSLNSAPAPAIAANPAAAPASLSRFPLRVISDTEGRFVFHDLPKGTYTITANKPGYAAGFLGQRTSTDTGPQSLMLVEGERRGNVTLSLWKFGAIGGTVVDEAGEPVIGIQVRVFKRATVSGKPRFTQFGNMPTTDDRGAYRIASLSPGEYVVGIVTTQTTVPTTLMEAYTAAGRSGTSQELQRELDRSAGLLRMSGLIGSGQRVGSLLLQTPIGIGSQRDVMAPPVDRGKVSVYPTVFYPAAATLSKAALVTVQAAEERPAIDFQLRPVVTSRVSGTLTGPKGPESHTTLDLMPAGSDDAQRDYDFAAASTATDATGAFTFLGVPPGAYIVRVLKIPPRPVTQSTMGTVIQTGSSTIALQWRRPERSAAHSE